VGEGGRGVGEKVNGGGVKGGWHGERERTGGGSKRGREGGGGRRGGGGCIGTG